MPLPIWPSEFQVRKDQIPNWPLEIGKGQFWPKSPNLSIPNFTVPNCQFQFHLNLSNAISKRPISKEKKANLQNLNFRMQKCHFSRNRRAPRAPRARAPAGAEDFECRGENQPQTCYFQIANFPIAIFLNRPIRRNWQFQPLSNSTSEKGNFQNGKFFPK